MIQEIRVGYTEEGTDTVGQGVLAEAQRTLGVQGISKVRSGKVISLEGQVTSDELVRLAENVFSEQIAGQKYTINQPLFTDTPHVVHVRLHPGVLNAEANTALEVAHMVGVPSVVATDISSEYAFYGENLDYETVETVVKQLRVNPTIQEIVYERPKTLLVSGESGAVNEVPIRAVSDEQLQRLSKEGKLYLSLPAMRVIQQYFINKRREPMDAELNVLAGWWSEHCNHNTFKSPLEINGKGRPSLISQLREASQQYFDGVVSAFVDNSGVVDGEVADDEGNELAFSMKVETHNKPSGLEPYGGANTGVGGVIRDPLGTGKGGPQIVATTNMFQMGPPDLPRNKVPQGCLHPDYIFRGVVAGVGGYGNPYGVPTVNGSVRFHPDSRATPTVIVGAYGIMPKQLALKGEPRMGDTAYIIGSRTGPDGIGGATFSSVKSDETTSSIHRTSVQIGDPIIEIQMADVIEKAGKKGLISAINDFGAAGIPSGLGEMGDGVSLDIGSVKLKYPGLRSTDILQSESQERMGLAVSPENVAEFLTLCKKYKVEATPIGTFDGSHKFKVVYGDKFVAELDYTFLRNGYPKETLIGHWEKPSVDNREPPIPTNWTETVKSILRHGDVCSKEPIVRTYDHGVQGGVVRPPLTGVNNDGPADGAVLTPVLGKPNGMVIAHGMSSVRNRIDPRRGAHWAVTEAMANFVAAGGNPKKAYLVNNYVWPGTDPESLGSLAENVGGVVDSIHGYKRPVISGKDSLSSRYEKGGERIDIPPVTCISVCGPIPDVKKTVTSAIKKPGSTLCLVGAMDTEYMGGSIYYDINNLVGNDISHIDFETTSQVFEKVHSGITSGDILSCHDVSEGGLFTTVAEMCFGGDCGANVGISATENPENILLNETAGCFVAEFNDAESAHRAFSNVPHIILGTTTSDRKINVKNGESLLFTADVPELKEAWQEPMKKIF